MDDQAVRLANVPPSLAYSFNKRERFNIAHATSNFRNHDIVVARFAQFKKVAFNFIGNVRYYLHSFTQIVAPSFLGYNIVVDASGCNIVVL